MARMRDFDRGLARGNFDKLHHNPRIERSGSAKDNVESPEPADAAIVWNQLMLDAIEQSASAPTVASRAMAMESLAVFNAVAAIERTQGYRVDLITPEGASADAAVAQAAHDVLVHLFPAQSAMFDAQLVLSLAAIADGQSKSDGVALGSEAAATMIALRADDGWNTPIIDNGSTEIGVWRPTPPGFLAGATPQWADLEPFALTSPDQFLPEGPPELSSRAYARSLREVGSLGEADSTARTAEQTEIATFWAYGPGTSTPPGGWNEIATMLAQQEGLGLADTARLLAVLNVAEADAAIAAWDAKYHYDTWRPITAIQNASDIGNRWIDRWKLEDPDWQPLLITPPFPEYVSGHSTFSAAAAEILTSFFGKRYEFSFTAPNGVTREFRSFRDAAEEAADSRLYGGIHFDFGNEDGLELGEQIGEWVLDTFSPSQDIGLLGVSTSELWA